ncbi:DUF3289 domain-containing protein [Paramixta manurensis]|uniref:DUF3289 domain-containing protein n=1 Tax=Paramixta manurensis TaxID=2740817 RepID=A0A6M8U5G8_9GAMM|nr:DUF3289 domain-containing protein [Erwiniaceae bacterium PD-1]
MPALSLPCTIYQTQHRFNDYGADDMKCGELTERQLRTEFDLDDVSDVVNPWTGEEVSLFSAFRKSRVKNKPEIARLLFNEFLRLSMPAYYLGKRQLFIDLVKHFYNGRGNPFSSPFLEQAYRQQIETDADPQRSSLLIIKNFLSTNIDWENNTLSSEKIPLLTHILSGMCIAQIQSHARLF